MRSPRRRTCHWSSVQRAASRWRRSCWHERAARADGDAKDRGDDHRDPPDEKGDEIRGELEAPGRGVRATAVELVKHGPRLPGDRGEAAEQLGLDRKAERARDHDRREALRPIE